MPGVVLVLTDSNGQAYGNPASPWHITIGFTNQSKLMCSTLDRILAGQYSDAQSNIRTLLGRMWRAQNAYRWLWTKDDAIVVETTLVDQPQKLRDLVRLLGLPDTVIEWKEFSTYITAEHSLGKIEYVKVDDSSTDLQLPDSFRLALAFMANGKLVNYYVPPSSTTSKLGLSACESASSSPPPPQAGELVDFSIEVEFTGDGLLGGIHEYAPYLGMHTTFGANKVVRRLPLELSGDSARPASRPQNAEKADNMFGFDRDVLSYRLAEQLRFNLAHTERTRGDDSIWFEVWCCSRNSGLHEIDEKESRCVTRHISCGVISLELYTLMKAHADTKQTQFTLTRLVTDNKIVDVKLNEYRAAGVHITEQNYRQHMERAMQETHKGVLQFHITVNRFDAAQYRNSIFGHSNMKTELLHAVKPLGAWGPYVDKEGDLRWGDHEEKDAKHVRPTTKEYRGADGKIHRRDTLELRANFAPILYTSEKGIERMMQCLEKDILTPYARHFMKLDQRSNEPLIQPLNKQISQLQMPMWVSKMGHGPVFSYWSCHDPTTREYATEAERQADLELYGFDERTERLLTTMLHASLRRHGLSPELFQRTIQEHFSLKNKSKVMAPLMSVCRSVIADVGTFAANQALYTADYRFVTRPTGKKLRAESHMVVLDSWDNTILNNIGNSDDCEGMDNTATTIIRSYATGRHTLDFRWESALLNTVQLYLSHSVVYDVGATVTSAYVNTNNEKIDLKKNKDLPMVGDAMDLNSECAGHCHALMGSLLDCLTRLENGSNIGDEVLEKIRAAVPACPLFRARDAQRQMLVLEPTGSIDENILPLQEAFGHDATLLRKKMSERLFLKVLRARLDKRREEGAPDISDMFMGEGMPYYVEKQKPQRRISAFYNEVVHASSIDLMKRFHPSLGQFAFCRRVQGQFYYGVKIADMIRHPQEYTLITPFYETRHRWDTEVRPFVEALQHQLPLMAFGRYSDEQYAQVRSEYLRTEEVTARRDYETVSRPSGTATKEAAAFEERLHGVALNANQSVVRLYTRPWKLQSDEKLTKELKQFIASTPGLVAHGWRLERHLPVCPLAVEIHCVVDVEAVMAYAKKHNLK